MIPGRVLAAVTLAALILGVGGCARKGKLYRIEGVVTYDDKPLEGAEIRFFREDGTGTPATAVSGPGGEYRLTTHTDGDGATEGRYKVLVTTAGSTAEANAGTAAGDPKGLSKAMEEHAKKTRRKDSRKVPIPASYGDPSKTTLRYVVPPADGSGRINIELRKSGTG